MNDDLERKLLVKYPKIFSLDHSVLGSGLYWGIECGDGWFNLLETLCDDIQACVDDGMVHQVKLNQVKEKFGELRIYYSGGNDRVKKLIKNAENTAQTTCENCGCLGLRQRTRHGWVKTLCHDCMVQVGQS